MQTDFPNAVKSGKVGLAINSQPTRNQDQLHIHMSCLNARVFQELTKSSSPISSTWTQITLGPTKADDRLWYAIHIKDIGVNNPFSVLRTNNQVLKNMASQNLVVSQAPQGGFFILNSHYSSGEALLDQKLNPSQSDCK